MAEDDDLPRLLSGRYRLEAALGQGGMGVVYRGIDLMMKRPVAVKLIRPVEGLELDDEAAGRFLREAKNTARLQHEHIVEVFDLGRAEDGSLYFVMELLGGESLSARLRREGALSPASTVHIGRQICDGLNVAHTAGIVHRDLKPANIMLLSRAGYDDYVKVLDFGVAKYYGPEQETQLTHAGMLIGTVDYMAPEQITGKPVDGRTDIYALGVLLYRMLSGRPPFRDTAVPALINAHLNTMPMPLKELVPGIPNELDHVVLRCLAKRPERRFESMAELSRALVAALTSDGGLIDLAYDPGDPFDATSDATAVERGFGRSPLDDLTVSEGGDLLDDATIRMDRPPPMLHQPYTRPMPTRRAGAPPPLPSPQAPAPDVRRSAPDAAWPAAPQTCAMCRTLNAPHARACAACGVALGSAPHGAPPRIVGGLAPPMPGSPGPFSGPYPASPYGPPPSGAYGAAPPPGAPWLPQEPEAPPSMWQRFLAWTGLRGR